MKQIRLQPRANPTLLRRSARLRRFACVGGILAFSILWQGSLAVLSAPPIGHDVTLAWNPSSSSAVTGYRLYYGATSGNYSNSLLAGNVTALTVPGLTSGIPYFFTVVAFTATGLESAFSNEIVYVPGGTTVQINVAANRQVILLVAGPTGRTYNIEASQTPTGGWTVIGTVTVGAGGSVNFTDTNAPSFTRRFYRTRDTTP